MEKSLVRVKMSPRRDENVENYEYRQLDLILIVMN